MCLTETHFSEDAARMLLSSIECAQVVPQNISPGGGLRDVRDRRYLKRSESHFPTSHVIDLRPRSLRCHTVGDRGKTLP